MLWYLQRFSKGEILKSLLGLFISLSISFLAGSPPVVFLQCIIVFTYFTIYFLSKFFTTHESSAIKNGFSIAYIFYFSLSLILLLLVLVQFKETHTLSLLAARRYWPEEFYFGFSSKVRSFMHLFYGNWFEYFPDFGNEEFFAYSGILISLLAIIGLTTAKFKRLEITFLFLGILGFVFAHATNPIYKYAFYHFPFFSEFRAPGRFIFLSLISLLYFAGLGIQTIQNGQLKSSKYLIVSIIFFSITYFIIPFYKNTNSMPFNQIGFSKFYIDALFFLLSISLISISLKYSQVIFLSIILLPLDLYYHAKNTMPMKELPKIKVSSSNLRYIPKNLNESLHDNFSLLGKGNSMVGYLTLEQYSVYKFKEMFFSLPDKKRLTFARAGALEFAVNNCDFAWNTNNFQFINKENLLLSLANYSEDTCPVFMDTIDTFSDFPNSKIFYQSVITEHVNFEKYRFSIKNSKIQKGILYVSIAHHPNWKAFMKNNLSLKIIKANYAFMAIVIPEELDEVLLEYKLFSF
jgi:hypothetical protein